MSKTNTDKKNEKMQSEHGANELKEEELKKVQGGARPGGADDAFVVQDLAKLKLKPGMGDWGGRTEQ